MPRKTMPKFLGGAVLAAVTLTSGVERANADLGDALLGAGAAAAIGCATGIICKGNNRRSTTRAPSRSSGISQAQRQQNRDVQSALNAFGFPAGTPDGILGSRSRSAISDYQGYMGYQRTGQLTDWERQTLTNGWNRLQAGAGNAYPRTMAAVGPRGLLNIERDPNYPAQFGDQVAFGSAQGATGNTGGSWDHNSGNTQPNLPAAAQPLADTGPQAVQPLATPLQPLKRAGQVIASAAGRCELVDQTTRIQGGVIRASNMTDPNQALSEKFCEARGFAITQGQAAASQFAVSENELNGLCDQVRAGFAGVIGQLPNQQPAQAIESSKAAATALGLTDPATAKAYGQICMGIGYRLDNAEMALSGALVMVAAGDRPYGELMGHHLREGFGVAETQTAAFGWYKDAISSLEQGAAPAFVPSTTNERIQVIRAALQLEEQRASGGVLPQVVPASSQIPLLQPINQ